MASIPEAPVYNPRIIVDNNIVPFGNYDYKKKGFAGKTSKFQVKLSLFVRKGYGEHFHEFIKKKI